MGRQDRVFTRPHSLFFAFLPSNVVMLSFFSALSKNCVWKMRGCRSTVLV